MRCIHLAQVGVALPHLGLQAIEASQGVVDILLVEALAEDGSV